MPLGDGQYVRKENHHVIKAKQFNLLHYKDLRYNKPRIELLKTSIEYLRAYPNSTY